MIDVLNDFGLLKRIYAFWSKGDPVGQGAQLGLGTSRTGHPVRLGTSPPGWPVLLVPNHPVGGTGTGASLVEDEQLSKTTLLLQLVLTTQLVIF